MGRSARPGQDWCTSEHALSGFATATSILRRGRSSNLIATNWLDCRKGLLHRRAQAVDWRSPGLCPPRVALAAGLRSPMSDRSDPRWLPFTRADPRVAAPTTVLCLRAAARYLRWARPSGWRDVARTAENLEVVVARCTARKAGRVSGN